MALDPKIHTLAGLAGTITPEVAFLVLAQAPPRKVAAIAAALARRLASAGKLTAASDALALSVANGARGALPNLGARAAARLGVDAVVLAREVEADALRELADQDSPALAAKAAEQAGKHLSAAEKATLRHAAEAAEKRAEAARAAKILADKAVNAEAKKTADDGGLVALAADDAARGAVTGELPVTLPAAPLEVTPPPIAPAMAPAPAPATTPTARPARSRSRAPGADD